MGKIKQHVWRHIGIYMVLFAFICTPLLMGIIFLPLALEKRPFAFLPFLWSVLWGAQLIGAVGTLLYLRWLRGLSNLARQLGSCNWKERQVAFQQLLKMGRKAVSIFIQTLSMPPGRIHGWVDWDGDAARRLAAEGLGRLKAKEAVDALIDVLNDPDAELRAKAVWALGEIGDERSIPTLIPLLGDTAEIAAWHYIHDEAADALFKLGEKDLVIAFKQAMQQHKEALAQLQGRYRNEVIAGLMKALDSPPNFLAISLAIGAAWTLGELGAVEALPRLKAKARSVLIDKRVKEACKEAIAKLEPLAKLPRPVSGITPDTATLPRPASVSEISKDTLPRPADKGL